MQEIGCYRPGTRNVKRAPTASGPRCPPIEFDDPMPCGCGEKSVYIVNGYLRLTREDASPSRYHMGFSGDEDKLCSMRLGRLSDVPPGATPSGVADCGHYFLGTT